MDCGHHGANHPVKDMKTGKVEITSMNHGFTVDRSSLPENIFETHISLFDNTNCGIELKGRNIFSVQFHPEAVQSVIEYSLECGDMTHEERAEFGDGIQDLDVTQSLILTNL